MDTLYDIFDLAEFPIIITDRKFTIIYKNNLASKFFGKMRKRSKIIKYMSDSKRDIDFLGINESEFETGTQIKRALSISLDENSLIFLFFSSLQLNGYRQTANYIKENFNNNFIDFYMSAYREYAELQNENLYSQANVPERIYNDLLHLIHYFEDKPEFMNKEAYDIAFLLDYISKRVGSSFRAFGLKLLSAKISENARAFCHFNINLNEFLFIVFRMIYIAFKLSYDGNAQLSLDYTDFGKADVCITTYTHVSKEDVFDGRFKDLLHLLPEFSFEFEMLEKLGLFKYSLSYSIIDSVLKIHFKINCQSQEKLMVRSEPLWQREERIARAVSDFLAKTKILFSKNLK